ncbi:MAG TPA: hypothetical protein VHV77_07305 [Pirellulales bacterium]|nr:hypothetical protein [Pirellulales bacterium]
MEGDAVCFFHPEKKAALTCDRCGRFLCELCDLPLGTRHLCPTCIGGGMGTEKLPELITRRVRWSRVSLLLGILPLLGAFTVFLAPVMMATGPAAIFTGFYSWNKPGSLIRGPRRWEAVIGIALGLIQIGVLASIFYAFWNSTPHATTTVHTLR